jgi:hypothetical protein
MTHAAAETFPPYHLLDAYSQAMGKTRKLERLYHQTQEQAWDPRAVLDELVAKHGPIALPPDKSEAIGQVFTVLLWGELAAWNIAADLARTLPDVDAKMAATGQVFDEARHFRVLRDYLARANVRLPPVNPYGRRVLRRVLDTDSVLQKLYGMQLLVENLALAIFKQLAESNVEPVLTDLLRYIERDEARHVALGVMYLPTLLARTTPLERAQNWAFNVELFVLTIAGGQFLDPYFRTMNIDHRELGITVMRLHQQVLRQMAADSGVMPGELRGVYGLSKRQHNLLIDFFHPAGEREELPFAHRKALDAFGGAVRAGARWLS